MREKGPLLFVGVMSGAAIALILLLVLPFGPLFGGNGMNLFGDVVRDRDRDDDGIFNYRDNCKDEFNPDQRDRDGDGIGDACDPNPTTPDGNLTTPATTPRNASNTTVHNSGYRDDDDDDGIFNYRDNCKDEFNPDQRDRDGDGIGDACDPNPTTSTPVVSKAPLCSLGNSVVIKDGEQRTFAIGTYQFTVHVFDVWQSYSTFTHRWRMYTALRFTSPSHQAIDIGRPGSYGIWVPTSYGDTPETRSFSSHQVTVLGSSSNPYNPSTPLDVRLCFA